MITRKHAKVIRLTAILARAEVALDHIAMRDTEGTPADEYAENALEEIRIMREVGS